MRRFISFLTATALFQGVNPFLNKTATEVEMSGPDVPTPQDFPTWLNSDSTWTDPEESKKASEFPVIIFSANSTNVTNTTDDSGFSWGQYSREVQPLNIRIGAGLGGMGGGLLLYAAGCLQLYKNKKKFTGPGMAARNGLVTLLINGGAALIGFGLDKTGSFLDNSMILLIPLGMQVIGMFAQELLIYLKPIGEPKDFMKTIRRGSLKIRSESVRLKYSIGSQEKKEEKKEEKRDNSSLSEEDTFSVQTTRDLQYVSNPQIAKLIDKFIIGMWIVKILGAGSTALAIYFTQKDNTNDLWISVESSLGVIATLNLFTSLGNKVFAHGHAAKEMEHSEVYVDPREYGYTPLSAT